MKRLALITLLALSLTGCAIGPFAPEIPPGAPESAVINLYGNPAAVYPTANGRVLEWYSSPDSQHAYMAEIDAAGRIVWHGDVRTIERFALIVPGKSNKNDLLRTIGHPSEVEYLSLKQQEVWSYRFSEEMMWDSIMHFYFDGNGVVTQMEKGMDDRFLERNFMRIGSRRRR